MNLSYKGSIGIILLSLFIGIIIFSFTWTSDADLTLYQYHSLAEKKLFELQDFPTESNSLFTGSGTCLQCHGDPSQFPSSSANLDSLGNDVSPVTTWSATMMANSSKDPFWRAKVSHEGIENPELASEVETLCTKCHAPMGHFDALHNGIDFYSISNLEQDPLGLDGVSCNACHMIEDTNLGITFSGNIDYNTDHVEYGQFTDPFQNPMINHIGFTPEFSSHISSSETCSKCHTLITETITEDGELSGNSFVEQAIYHEWLNSNYPTEGISCISCHMETLSESVKLSPMPPWLDARNGFSTHDIVGANVFMLSILKDNSEALGVNASPSQFDSTIVKATRMLQSRSLDLDVNIQEISSDSLFVELVLHNKTGHKLPSGYPSRKVMIEFTISTLEGDTLFRSGGFDAEGRIIGEPEDDFEMHHTIIDSEDEVQLYEYVMGDQLGAITTVLTRAYSPLKDNRIPPLGFSISHASYDTVKIVGDALLDPDFNYDNAIEGSGTDKIYYHIPLLENYEGLLVNAKVHYITLPVKWLDELFENDSPEITSFQEMYNEEEMQSVIMQEEEVLVSFTSINENELKGIKLFPNPSNGSITISTDNIGFERLVIYNINGKKMSEYTDMHDGSNQIELPNLSGKYLLNIQLDDGSIVTKTVLKL